METTETLTQSLRQAGLRITDQRLAICRLLAESRDHPTALQIYQNLKGSHRSLSLATVYNTLDVLVSLGKVNALGHAGDGNVHFDPDTSPHINLACTVCHQIVDITSEYITALDREISASSGYRLIGSRVLYYGICPACQQQTGEQPI